MSKVDDTVLTDIINKMRSALEKRTEAIQEAKKCSVTKLAEYKKNGEGKPWNPSHHTLKANKAQKMIRAKTGKNNSIDKPPYVGGVAREWKRTGPTHAPTIELQVVLKDYNGGDREIRFNSSTILPHVIRPRMKICVISNAKDADAAQKHELQVATEDMLVAQQKNKKALKKFAQKYDGFLVSQSLVAKIPRLVGPTLKRANKNPLPVRDSADLMDRHTEMKKKITWSLKKNCICLAQPVAHLGMEDREIKENVLTSINFAVSLLKKNWNSVKKIYVHATFDTTRGHILYR